MFESVMNMGIKYLLLLFNLFFVLTGIILISVGAAVQNRYHGYVPFLDSAYFSVPAFLIAIGVIIFLVAIFGICGAVKENYVMTLIFLVLLILIFILELAAGISGYVLRNRTDSILQKNLIDSIPAYYNGTADVTLLWDDVQKGFECCGVHNPKDWSALPISCCHMKSGVIETFNCFHNSSDILHATGCYDGLTSYVKSHAGSLGAAGIFIAIAQLLGILFACHLTRKAKEEMTFN